MKALDISYHDGNIDFKKLKEAGINAVIIRAGYGKHGNEPGYTVDSMFKQNIEKAIKADMNIGVYWFGYAYSKTQAAREAARCVEIIKPYRDHINMPVFYDWEYASADFAKKHGVKPGMGLITTMIGTACDKIEAAGYKAGFYFNRDYARNYIDVRALPFVKWYARYKNELTAEEMKYDLWQYTEAGKVAGIGGTFDLDKVLNPDALGLRTTRKTNKQIVDEVIAGKWEAGYNYATIQRMVNAKLKGNK